MSVESEFRIHETTISSHLSHKLHVGSAEGGFTHFLVMKPILFLTEIPQRMLLLYDPYSVPSKIDDTSVDPTLSAG